MTVSSDVCSFWRFAAEDKGRGKGVKDAELGVCVCVSHERQYRKHKAMLTYKHRVLQWRLKYTKKINARFSIFHEKHFNLQVKE